MAETTMAGVAGATTVVREVAVTAELGAMETRWRQLEARAVGSPLQHFDFVRAWFGSIGRATGAEPMIVHGDGFILPFAVSAGRFATVARFPGGSHANYNVGLFEPDLHAALTEADIAEIWRTIASARPDVDLIACTAMPASIGGRPNPLVGRRALAAPHDSFDLSLEGGFEAVLARHKGAKKRKAHRNRLRSFDAIGGARTIFASDGPTVRRIVETFFEQKRLRLARHGLPNVFDLPGTREHFLALADAGALQASALEAGGLLRATLIGLVHGGTCYLQVNSFAMDEFERASPGELLLFDTIRKACEMGCSRLDFGVGDARYKRSWSDGTIALTDDWKPLTPLGFVLAGVLRARAIAKRRIISDPRLHAIAKRIRGRISGRQSEPAGSTGPEADGD